MRRTHHHRRAYRRASSLKLSGDGDRTAGAKHGLRPEPVQCSRLVSGVYTCAGLTISNDPKSAKLLPIVLRESIRGAVLLGLLAAVPLAAAQSGGSDPRFGIWTLISAESKLDPPNRLSITHLHDGVHVVMTGETHFDFTAAKNGHDSPAAGNLGFNQIELRRGDKRQAEVREKKDGTLVSTVREKLSKD